MLKNYANFNVNEPPKYINPSELSVNSNQNYYEGNFNLEQPLNEFLNGINQ